MKVLQELWPHGYISSKAHLDKNMDVKALAKYLVDKTKGGQKEDDRKKHSYRFSFSKNCINPVVTYEHINSKRWRKEPKPPKGYELIKDTLVNSVTESGYLYQRYEIRKISDKNKSCRKNI